MEDQLLPIKPIPIKDRISVVSVEKGNLGVLHGAFVVVDKNGVRTHIPVGGVACLMLEMGTRISHAAVRVVAQIGRLLVWIDEPGVRLYSAGQPGGARADRLLYQASLALDDDARLKVVREMYRRRFGERLQPDAFSERVRTEARSTIARDCRPNGVARLIGLRRCGALAMMLGIPDGDSHMHSRLCRSLAFAAALLIGTTSPLSQAEVPSAVQAKLARGINLSFWFTYRGNPTIDPQLFRPDDADLSKLRKMGFRHVRIAFDYAWLVDAGNPAHANPQRAAELGDALQQIASHDLMAVVTMNADNDYLKRLLGDPVTLNSASAFWWSLARQLSSRLPSDKLVFEVLNEPGDDDAAASLKVMQTLAGSVRDAAPAYTIAVAGHKYSSIDELLALVPFQDKNLVYTFHFYEPFNFTHQGASWGWPMWAKFHGFPYPSSVEALAPVLPTLDADARPHAAFYGQQNWDRAKLAAMLDRVAEWKNRNQVPVWCSEFGAVKTVAPPGSREAWLRDTRELLEARGIPWTHFDFAQHMGLVDGPQGARRWNRGAVEALGLRAPPDGR